MAWLFMPRAFDILTPEDIADSYTWYDITAFVDAYSEANVTWSQVVAPSSS